MRFKTATFHICYWIPQVIVVVSNLNTSEFDAINNS